MLHKEQIAEHALLAHDIELLKVIQLPGNLETTCLEP